MRSTLASNGIVRRPSRPATRIFPGIRARRSGGQHDAHAVDALARRRARCPCALAAGRLGRRSPRPGRGQHLFLSRAAADRPAAQGLHGEDRHQAQRGLCGGGPQRAAGGRGTEQPSRPAVHRRRRPPVGSQGCRPHPAGRFRGARAVGARPGARPRQPLVRPHHALARRLRQQGAGEAGRHHLRGAGRSQVEGQDLRPLGPARLQHIADRHHHRPQGRGGGRAMAEGPQGQPRPEAGRRRPRAGARHRTRASAIWRWATPTTWR